MALTNMELGGGSFTGKAVYGSGVFADIKEDVSDIISMISPRETPLLNAIGDAMYPAYSVLHEWLEDALNPNVIIASMAVASTTADTFLTVQPGIAAGLTKGAILRAPEVSGGEYLQITLVTDPTLTVSRAFAGTSANSFAAGEYLTVVAEAVTDGADVLVDVSRSRPRKTNFTQIFMKQIIISGTMQAVNQHGGITNELDVQIQRRTAEALRDLEKALVLGRLSGNTIGSATASRTFDGYLARIKTNSITVSSIGTDYGTTTMQFFEDRINAAIQAAWQAGGSDINLISCGAEVKKRFDQLNNQRVRVPGSEGRYSNRLVEYESTYGLFPVMLHRWMPIHMAAFLALPRMAVPPLNGRSFHYDPVAKTGDADKGMVLGEYTLEIRNEEGMASITFDKFAPAAGSRLIYAP